MSYRICLLRGVNVGGVKVTMADLKAIALEAGYEDPRTLLASGNLVIRSDDDPDAVEAALEAGVERHFGLRIEIMVRTPEHWRALIQSNPMPDQAAADPSHLLVMVMKSGVAPGAVEALNAFAVGEERVVEAGGALFFWHPEGIGRSKLAEKAQPRLMGVGTGRNWNTVQKLAEMVGV